MKPHGLAGEVVVELWTNVPGRLAAGVHLETDDGELVVASSRPHQGRHLVRFEGVTSREGADALRATVLRAPPRRVEGALWVHELVGARATSVSGRTLGQVVGVEANPASDLLVLEGGALVPLCFVRAFEPGTLVTLDLPEGLVE